MCGTTGKEQIDPGRVNGIDEAAMQFRRRWPSSSMSPKTAIRLGNLFRGTVAKRGESSTHGSGIGVVALIDQKNFAAGNLQERTRTPARAVERARPAPRVLCGRSAPRASSAATTASEFSAMWRARNGQMVGDGLAADDTVTSLPSSHQRQPSPRRRRHCRSNPKLTMRLRAAGPRVRASARSADCRV